jgi:hypothetical protein
MVAGHRSVEALVYQGLACHYRRSIGCCDGSGHFHRRFFVGVGGSAGSSPQRSEPQPAGLAAGAGRGAGSGFCWGTISSRLGSMSKSAHDVPDRRNKSFDLRIADRASASCWLSVIFSSLTSRDLSTISPHPKCRDHRGSPVLAASEDEQKRSTQSPSTYSQNAECDSKPGFSARHQPAHPDSQGRNKNCHRERKPPDYKSQPLHAVGAAIKFQIWSQGAHRRTSRSSLGLICGVCLLGSGLALCVFGVPGLIEFVEFVAPAQRLQPGLLPLQG